MTHFSKTLKSLQTFTNKYRRRLVYASSATNPKLLAENYFSFILGRLNCGFFRQVLHPV